MKKVSSVEQVVSYFKDNEFPLFFIGSLYGAAMMNIYPFVPRYQIITCCDPYFGAFPFITVPQFIRKGNHQCVTSGEPCAISLISHPEVISYMKSKDPKPKIIIKNPHIQIQNICLLHGFQMWFSSVQMYQYLGNKVQLLSILNQVSVPYIPNICSKITNYKHFKEILSQLGGQKFVVQDQAGCGGFGTMYISSQDDYKQYQSTLQNGKVFKIMRHRNLKCFAIVGVATHKGVIFGPLVSELVGHQRLTPYLGGYCGNQIRKSYFQDEEIDMKIRREIYKHTERFINYIYQKGLFRGSFGCDFSVDMDTNQIFFMEINPRLTGSTCLSFELYQAQGKKFPIYLYHCLEYLGVSIDLDVNALNDEWIQLQHYQQEYSYLIVRSFNLAEAQIPFTFPAGIWKLENGVLMPTGKIDFRMRNLQEDEVLFVPAKSMFKATMAFKGRIQDYNFKLTEKHKNIIYQLIDYRLKDKRQE